MLELSEAAPDREMDLLEQIAAFVGVGFVGAREALERRTEVRNRLPVQLVLRHPDEVCLRMR